MFEERAECLIQPRSYELNVIFSFTIFEKRAECFIQRRSYLLILNFVSI